MIFDQLLPILFSKIFTNSGDQAFLSQPIECQVSHIRIYGAIVVRDQDLVTVENGSDEKWNISYRSELNQTAYSTII
jgi:hypothetical protein